MSIDVNFSMQVNRPSDDVFPVRADPKSTMGLDTEDFIIAYGLPVVIDQIAVVTSLVSCEGLVLAESGGVEDLNVDADMRFSARLNATTTQWLPYVDKTWNSPRFEAAAPPSIENISWLKDRSVCYSTALYAGESNTMSLTDNLDLVGSMSVVMAVSPARTSSMIVFDELSIEINDGHIWIDTPSTSLARTASTGGELTILGVTFNSGTCSLYVKNGYEPIYVTSFPANSSGNMSFVGHMGVLCVDMWTTDINVATHMDTVAAALSGDRSVRT